MSFDVSSPGVPPSVFHRAVKLVRHRSRSGVSRPMEAERPATKQRRQINRKNPNLDINRARWFQVGRGTTSKSIEVLTKQVEAERCVSWYDLENILDEDGVGPAGRCWWDCIGHRKIFLCPYLSEWPSCLDLVPEAGSQLADPPSEAHRTAADNYHFASQSFM